MSLRALSCLIILASGCDCGPRLSGLSGELAVEPVDLDFGVLAPARQRVQRVQLTNRGNAPLELAVGTAAPPFQRGPAPTHLEVGGSASVEVVFDAPQQPGAYTGRLDVMANGETLPVSLQGTVVVDDAGFVESHEDAGTAPDAGAPADAGSPPDAGAPRDAGQPADAGTPVVHCGPGCGARTALGIAHTCTISDGGGVFCWGRAEEFGGPCCNVPVVRPEPHSYPEPVVSLAAGGAWGAGITASGTLYARGVNNQGELGQGHTQPVSGAVAVPLPGPVRLFSAGYAHACAAVVDAGVWCWGQNISGEVGDGTTMLRSSPVPISLPGPVAELAMGGGFSCARLTDGRVACWGGAAPPVPPSRCVPQLITGVTDAVALGTSTFGSCAVLPDAGVTCWQLGRTATPYPLPPVKKLTGGGEYWCALTLAGAVQCWGDLPDNGRLGDGSGQAHLNPITVSGLGAGVVDLFAPERAGATSCVLTADAGFWCWGQNIVGQVGDGTQTDRYTPVPISL